MHVAHIVKDHVTHHLCENHLTKREKKVIALDMRAQWRVAFESKWWNFMPSKKDIDIIIGHKNICTPSKRQTYDNVKSVVSSRGGAG